MSNDSNTPSFMKVGAVDTSEQLKGILETVCSASLLAVLNAMVISAPGTGKSSLLFNMSKQVFEGTGLDALPMYCAPSMRGEEWVGYENPAYLINRKQAIANGEPRWIINETPFDPHYPLTVLFEHSRIGEMADDVSLAAFDYGNDGFVNPKISKAIEAVNGEWYPHVSWSDSNFLNPSQRNEARRDRFPLMVYYKLPNVDMRTLMSKQEIKYWKFDLPTWGDVQLIRTHLYKWLEKPVSKQLDIIIAALEPIQEVAQSKNFIINHRRLRQWQKLLYACSAYYTGTPNFKEIPRQAFEALAYCYPTESYEQALEWYGIVLAGVDSVLTKIAEHEKNAYQQWQDTFYGTEQKEGIKKERNPQIRQQRITKELGALFAKSQTELRRQFPNDKRAIEAEGRLYEMYRKALRGEDI